MVLSLYAEIWAMQMHASSTNEMQAFILENEDCGLEPMHSWYIDQSIGQANAHLADLGAISDLK